MTKKSGMKNVKPWVIARQACVLLLALLAVVFWFNQERGTDLKRFCGDITRGGHYDDVIASAQSQGFSIPFYAREENRLTIFNKSGMLFEFGCTVHFSNSRAVDSTFFEK